MQRRCRDAEAVQRRFITGDYYAGEGAEGGSAEVVQRPRGGAEMVVQLLLLWCRGSAEVLMQQRCRGAWRAGEMC